MLTCAPGIRASGGDWEDLRQFERLASSPVRSPARQAALEEWSGYKKSRQSPERALAALKKVSGHAPPAHGKRAYILRLAARSVDLTGADLDNICVGYADLRGATLDKCSLRGSWFKGANFENASLRGAVLSGVPGQRGPARFLHANMHRASLAGADCRGVDFSFASLNRADLSGADLSDANLSHVGLVGANVDRAKLSNARVYGVAAWDLEGTPAVQDNLIISQDEPGGPGKGGVRSAVCVDRLEVAQFVNVLMCNAKIRDVIDTVGQKGVLILGRFTAERKRVLDALRVKLRDLGYLPMIFDFQRPTQRDFSETVMILAGLSRFIVADITNPKSSPMELQLTVPNYMIPLVPIIQKDEKPFAMFRDLWVKHNAWVLDPLRYDTAANLVRRLKAAVVDPAIERSEKLVHLRTAQMPIRDLDEYR